MPALNNSRARCAGAAAVDESEYALQNISSSRRETAVTSRAGGRNRQRGVGMDSLAANYGISAWKTYTQWGPDGKGFFLDDDAGIAFIEKARKLGIRNIAVHKGLPFGPRSYEHSTCVDVGRVARRYPAVNFLIYHSGFVAEKKEGPYDAKRTDGIDALVTSLIVNGVKPGSNVYSARS